MEPHSPAQGQEAGHRQPAAALCPRGPGAVPSWHRKPRFAGATGPPHGAGLRGSLTFSGPSLGQEAAVCLAPPGQGWAGKRPSPAPASEAHSSRSKAAHGSSGMKSSLSTPRVRSPTSGQGWGMLRATCEEVSGQTPHSPTHRGLRLHCCYKSLLSSKRSQTLGDGPGERPAEQTPRGSPGAPPAGTQMVLGWWFQGRVARCQAGRGCWSPEPQQSASAVKGRGPQQVLPVQPAAESRSGPLARPKSGHLRAQPSGALGRARTGHRTGAGGASRRGDAHE